MTKVAIGAIMKQEAPYILEWVYYHKALGFELIIADNGGQDDTSKILTALHNANIITRIDFRFQKKLPQIPAYRTIVRLAKQKEIDILGFLDCDEFFTRDVPIRALTPEFGAEHIASEFMRLDATQISYHWLLYGSQTNSSDITLPVLERFSHHSKIETKEHLMFKSFIKVAEMFKLSNLFFFTPKIVTPHQCHGANKKWYLDDKRIKKIDECQAITYNNGTILHFIIKTWEEFQSKVKRGDGAYGFTRYTQKFFQKNDLNDIEAAINPDVIIRLKDGINELKLIVGNYKEIDTKVSFFTTIKFKSMSMGLSDITNHRMAKISYQLWKKIRNFFGQK